MDKIKKKIKICVYKWNLKSDGSLSKNKNNSMIQNKTNNAKLNIMLN